MLRILLKSIMCFILLILIGLGIIFIYVQNKSAEMYQIPISQKIIISNKNFKKIALLLKEKNILPQHWLLPANWVMQLSYAADYLKEYYAYFRHHDYKKIIIHAGEYEFIGTISINKIKNMLQNGEVMRHIIQIIPGFSKYQVIELFNNAYFFKGDLIQLQDMEEGDMEADTYFFHHGTNRKKALNWMQKKWDKKMDKILAQNNNEFLKTKRDILIWASLLEKEIKTQHMPEVSGILWKRYKIKMRLQLDAPNEYSKKYFSDPELIKAYNTYLHRNLIPNPICYPSAQAIQASINPKKNTPYLFYLTELDPPYTAHFAKNYQEHLFYVKKYLRSRKVAKSKV